MKNLLVHLKKIARPLLGLLTLGLMTYLILSGHAHTGHAVYEIHREIDECLKE
jgi:hypothetical protein